MATELAGYARLAEDFQLAVRQLTGRAEIDSAAKGRTTKTWGYTEVLVFEPKYRPEQTLIGHMQFALKYEGINLEFLARLFEKTGASDIEALLAQKPESMFGRRIGYLYEWLTKKEIKAKVAPRSAYVKVVDEKLQFGMTMGPKNGKFRVIDNLPGNQRFCALARKTKYLQAMVDKNLKQRTADKLAQYDPALLSRAATFLYLKETHSSFEVEREKPPATRAQRFAGLLREAENGNSLSENRFVELQNAIVDPRFAEFTYRSGQNWIGQDLGHRKKVDFVPARPEHVRDLMDGLVKFSETIRANPEYLDPVISATALAFGFVFIHPFMDGNGRLHRFLIHDSLSASGFTPKGIVLPVSAVILANLAEYIETLEHFSRPLLALTNYNPDPPGIPAIGNDAIYYQYFDSTDQASFLYRALERTVEQDLEQEISFLLGFDAAYKSLKEILDWPAHSLDLFIQFVHQNQWTLSKTKRQSHFSWMTEEEIKRSEAIVAQAFSQK
jgi:Fic/DOC family